MPKPINKGGKHFCPQCKNGMWGVEYSHGSIESYDGVSEWWCNQEAGGCGLRIGRWSEKELQKGEVESALGRANPFVPSKCPDCKNYRNPIYPTCYECFTSS